MSDLQEYKCPCCGGAIAFDSRTQKMKCPYCDTEFEIDTLKQFEEEALKEDQDPQWQADNVKKPEEEIEEDGTFVSYVCESCGGEIVTEQTTAATSCPYCGNPVVIPKQFEGMLRPDLVIPFKLDKEQAKQRLREHFKGKALLPPLFKEENRIQEVTGVYVPFWLYDGDASAEIRCRATRVNCWRGGDYEYTETRHYLVSRSGDIGFSQVPVDGSQKMADELMESIEPFFYEDAVDFQTAYLAGYLADKYDEGAEACAARANERMKESTRQAFLNTIHGYATCVPEHTGIRLHQGKITYALLPVWVLNTRYRNQVYTFAMNGQTGKFVGNLPMDRGRALVTAGMVFAAATAVCFLALMLFG